MVELIEKTVISDDAIKYLKEVKKKFKGKISRAWMEQDYLTAPSDESEFKKGKVECFKQKLMRKADDGSSHSYIKYEITERGYEVLKLAK